MYHIYMVVQFSHSVVSNSLTPWTTYMVVVLYIVYICIIYFNICMCVHTYAHLYGLPHTHTGLPCDSDGKESSCNVGNLGSIPGSGRPLEEGMATHSSILAWRIPMDRGVWRATVLGVATSRT